jgi:hypothetical protein
MGWWGGGCQGGAIATLNYPQWIQLFPQFATNPGQAVVQMYYDLAGSVWLRNDGTGPVTDPNLQANLMNLLTAHVTTLFSGPDGNDPSGLVGRISSANEGSVSVSTEYESTMNSAWFVQTAAGSAFWQATAAFRSFPAYIPGPTRFGNGIGYGGFRGGRGCRAF